MRVVENQYLTEQFRFPRSKKKRIRAKWAKRPENNRPARKAMVMGDTIVCHPSIAAAIRKQVAEDQAEADYINSIFAEPYESDPYRRHHRAMGGHIFGD